MKKYYESADLHAVLSYSKIRKDYDLVLNVFVPSDIIEVKKVIVNVPDYNVKFITKFDLKAGKYIKPVQNKIQTVAKVADKTNTVLDTETLAETAIAIPNQSNSSDPLDVKTTATAVKTVSKKLLH